ncbi:MAG: ligase-associated DNA damage response endonuclease PdeM [Pseudomonadota bacterium]
MTALMKSRDHTSGLEISFQDEPLIIDPSGCVFWPDQHLLVVSDLHLEKGSSFASKRRTFLPPYDTQASLEKLAICIDRWQPQTIISLGDSFHDQEASERLPQSYRLRLRQMIEGREWLWISGNHDPQPPKEVGGTFCTEAKIGALNFIHEPKPEFITGEIAGHLHPSARIVSRGKRLRRRCVAGDQKRIILPAFGTFTGGLDLSHSAFEGLFEPVNLKAWMLGQKDVYCIDASQLR